MLDESRKIGTFGHGYTYTAHPAACAVALKTIEICERERMVDHVRRVAPVFADRINRLGDHPLVGEPRAIGLLGALELVADKKTRRPFLPKQGVGTAISDMLQDMGLIARAMGDSLAFCPPLIINADEINEMFDIVERGLDRLEEQVRIENLREAA